MEKYGSSTVEKHMARVSGMPQQEWAQAAQEEADYKAALSRAVSSGDPAGEDAKEAVQIGRAHV